MDGPWGFFQVAGGGVDATHGAQQLGAWRELEPGREPVGSVTMRQVRQIAEQKMTDLNANDLDAACRMIVGSAQSMGIEVRD